MKDQLHRLLVIPLLAAACVYTYRVESPESHTYAAAGISRVNAATQNGAIVVSAAPDSLITVKVVKYAYGRDKADAEAAIENVVYRDTIADGELRVWLDMPGGNRPYGASDTITVPESTDLSLSATNGGVTVNSVSGDVSAATTNGSIELTGTAGTASLSTTNGSLNVAVHKGPLYGATTNAAVDCDLAALGPTEDVSLATTNGKVTLLLPADVSARIDATTTNATITIYDFTVVYETQTEHHIRGRIGSGASEVTITTTNAAVVIRRRS